MVGSGFFVYSGRAGGAENIGVKSFFFLVTTPGTEEELLLTYPLFY